MIVDIDAAGEIVAAWNEPLDAQQVCAKHCKRVRVSQPSAMGPFDVTITGVDVDGIATGVLICRATKAESRLAAYRAAWTTDEHLEALHEAAMGRPEKLSALNAKREQIRQEIQ